MTDTSTLALLTHQVHFSCAHQVKMPGVTAEVNQEVYGEKYSEDGLGHNFYLQASLGGEHDPEKCLQFFNSVERVAGMLDHRFLNHHVLFFNSLVPTVENIARYCFIRLKETLDDLSEYLQSVRVIQGADLWVDYMGEGEQVDLTKSYKLNCVHRHHNPILTAQENLELYNKCSEIHGHEYTVEVTLSGFIESLTGLVYQRSRMDGIVQEKLLSPYDKVFLNNKLGNTSGEVISQHFHRILKDSFLDNAFSNLVLRETRKNSFFVSNC